MNKQSHHLIRHEYSLWLSPLHLGLGRSTSKMPSKKWQYFRFSLFCLDMFLMWNKWGGRHSSIHSLIFIRNASILSSRMAINGLALFFMFLWAAACWDLKRSKEDKREQLPFIPSKRFGSREESIKWQGRKLSFSFWLEKTPSQKTMACG